MSTADKKMSRRYHARLVREEARENANVQVAAATLTEEVRGVSAKQQEETGRFAPTGPTAMANSAANATYVRLDQMLALPGFQPVALPEMEVSSALAEAHVVSSEYQELLIAHRALQDQLLDQSKVVAMSGCLQSEVEQLSQTNLCLCDELRAQEHENEHVTTLAMNLRASSSENQELSEAHQSLQEQLLQTNAEYASRSLAMDALLRKHAAEAHAFCSECEVLSLAHSGVLGDEAKQSTEYQTLTLAHQSLQEQLLRQTDDFSSEHVAMDAKLQTSVEKSECLASEVEQLSQANQELRMENVASKSSIQTDRLNKALRSALASGQAKIAGLERLANLQIEAKDAQAEVHSRELSDVRASLAHETHAYESLAQHAIMFGERLQQIHTLSEMATPIRHVND